MNIGKLRVLVLYHIHVNTVSEEEIANIGGISVQVVRLQRRKSLQDVKCAVLKALRYEAQAQVHGI